MKAGGGLRFWTRSRLYSPWRTERFFRDIRLPGHGESSGEIVFNTSMSGYQEVLTDPSYAGQMVVMTYPHIGNYGINHQDVESARIRVEGFLVREYHPVPSNWRSERSLASYLSEAGIVGMTGLDTRAPDPAHPASWSPASDHLHGNAGPGRLGRTGSEHPVHRRGGPGSRGDLPAALCLAEPRRQGANGRRTRGHRGLGPNQEPVQGRGHGLRDQVQYPPVPDTGRGRGPGRARPHFG